MSRLDLSLIYHIYMYVHVYVNIYFSAKYFWGMIQNALKMSV